MKAIKKMRLDSGLTQKQVAEKTGLSVSWISKLENGQIDMEDITVVSMLKLLKVYSDASQLSWDIFTDFKSAYLVLKSLISDY